MKRSIGHGVLVGLAVSGCLGILASLPPIGSTRAAPRGEEADAPLVIYENRRVARFHRRVRGAPEDPELRLELALAYASQATARAHQAYGAAFPDGSTRDAQGAGHYELWRRGWHRRDPDGDLRCAMMQARRALLLNPSTRRRLAALRLIVHIHRQQCRDATAAASLREIVAIEPDDQAAWLQLYELYHVLGDRRRFREARKRLRALDAASGALVPER